MATNTKPRFEGFSRDLPKFLGQLQKHNEKAWFDAHRAQYEELYLEPAKAFVNALAAALPKSLAAVQPEPRVGGSIMRINRDTRFAKDKRPYKDALHFILPLGAGHRTEHAGFYFRIAPETFGWAAGHFGFDGPRLAAYRKAVADPKAGKALRQAIEKVRKAGPYELPEPHYKRVPRGFDPEHPNADLLRHQGISLHAETRPPKALFGPEAVAFCIDRMKELLPIPAWVETHVMKG